MPRSRLPNRRPSETFSLSAPGQDILVTVGYSTHDMPLEVFISGGKEGTHIDGLLADISVTISIALQHGIRAEALAKSIGRVPLAIAPSEIDTAVGTEPASAVGVVLDLLQELEAEIAA